MGICTYPYWMKCPRDENPSKTVWSIPPTGQTAYSFIRKQAEEGHQVYVICPMVEEGEMDGLENVMDYTDKLKADSS